MRPARPGDSIQDFFTTKVFNKLLRGEEKQSQRGRQRHAHVPVIFSGSSSTAIQMYEPVIVTGPTLSNEDPGELAYNAYYEYPPCNVSTSGLNNYALAVTQEPINNNQPGACLVMGLSWVKANVTDLSHEWLDASTGSLVSDESKGKARIITPPGSTGVGYCLALFGMMPSTVQTVITDIRVTATTVQYKTRDLIVHCDDEESDWIDLASVVCPEIP